METEPCLCWTCKNQQNPLNKFYCSKLDDVCSGECEECCKATHCDKYAEIGD